jgi:hypothetical protein
VGENKSVLLHGKALLVRGSGGGGEALNDGKSKMADGSKRTVGTIVQIDFLGIDDVAERTTLDFGMNLQWQVEMNPFRAAAAAAEFPTMQVIEKPEWVPDVQFYGTAGSLEFLLEPSYFRYQNVGFCYFNWNLFCIQ